MKPKRVPSLELQLATLSVDTQVNITKVGYISLQLTLSGTGYVESFDDSDDTLTITVTSETEGLFDLSIIYAAPNGEKYTSVSLNGEGGSQVYFKPTETFASAAGGQVLLKAGENTIAFQTNWGWYLIDAITLTPTEARPPHNIPATPVNSATTQAAKTLLKYLIKNYGSFILSGQQELSGVTWIEENIGKTPAILGLDLIDYSPSRVEHGTTSQAIEEAIAWDKRGGIVTFCWHWNAPTGLYDVEGSEWWSGFYTRATDFDISTALADTTNANYTLLIRDIDAIAVQLKRLQDADVPVLWRPLHEADGAWFWWGAKGAEPCKKLWDIVYERLTTHHKLNNLIWTWNSVSEDWYPGDETVDIVSYDSYPATAGDHSVSIHLPVPFSCSLTHVYSLSLRSTTSFTSSEMPRSSSP